MAKTVARRWQNGNAKKRIPPNLFGPYDKTGFLATLALNGPRLAVDLCEHYGADVVKGRSADRSGIVARWRSGERAIAVGLNQKHPLHKKLLPLLKAIAKNHGVPNLQNCRLVSAASGACRDAVDLDLTFGSRVRTQTLLAVQVLRGRASLTELSFSIPGEFCKAIKTAVKHFVAEGVLETRNGMVKFAKSAYLKELLAVLSVAGQLQPQRINEIRGAYRVAKRRPPRPMKYGLLGLDHTQRVLSLLAQHGPMRYARLFAKVKSQNEQTLKKFVLMGIVIDQRANRVRTISLNRLHPIHRELRRFLISIADEPRRGGCHDLSADVNFSVDFLFGRRLRTAVLLALDAADDGLDASMLHRLLPEHDRLSLRLCLERFAEIGVLGTRRVGNTLRYDFDPEWPHYGALRGLLSPINNRWPELAAHAVQVADELRSGRWPG